MGIALSKTIPEPDPLTAANKTVGAVVIGGDYQGLGVVRSLGRHGVPVCIIDDEHSISRFSRYSTHFSRVPSLRDEARTVETLIEVGSRLGLQGWVLYPTREELVVALSRNKTKLSEIFCVPTPAWETIRWAWDKRNTYQLAGELGIPIPATHYPETIDQLDALSHLSPPFAIKPAIKEHFFYATKAKAWLANSHAELKHMYGKASRFVQAGEIMVQELIPGGGAQQFAYCAFFRHGKAIGKMMAQRRRQHPVQFGRSSTYVETVDIPELEERSERFLRAIDYYGLVELEYKLDPRDSEYKLLDVNARTWGYHSLGPKAGVDFSYMLYADQMGLPVPTCRAQPGVGWVRMTTDLPAAFMAMVAGDVSPKGYLKSLKSCNVEAVFSSDDPLPGVAEVLMVPYLAIKRGF